MANPTISISFSPPDPTTCPETFTEAVAVFNSLVVASMQGTFTTYVVSSTTPAVNDQDKVWLKTDGAGRPLGIYLFYNGSWRKFYTGRPNEISMFTGDPAVFFDGTGLGLTTERWDGWAIANGQNGTVNLSDKFVIGARMDNVNITGYSSGWRSNISGTPQSTGGAASYTLINNNLPKTVIQLTGAPYDPGANISPGKVIVDDDYRQGANRTVELARFGADPDANPPIPQIAVPTIPPFYALAFCQWVGYA